MSRVLLDTNIISAFFKGNPAVVEAVTDYVKRHKRLSYSIITHDELLRGFMALGSDKKLAAYRAFSAQCEMLPLSDQVVEQAAMLYAALKSSGNLIDDADLLIAATALQKKLTLVTDNQQHFKRVPHLKLQNWLYS